ncbi:MAG TPA: class I SAM-dependent methyltransferase [Burkholderiales bacterium]|nr:class I SAM-dependent methyltransferase [Burkholderiales bacterium]
MNECGKSMLRRVHDIRFATRYFVGDGIDVGAGEDPLHFYAELFPAMRSCRAWEWNDGDGATLPGVADESFDFVHASHSLEHLDDPRVALRNWARVLRPGGHIVILVPDEDLYEQGTFPSRHNEDHKWTFTVAKKATWSPRSVSLAALAQEFADRLQTVKIELLDATFRFSGRAGFDQTQTPIGECAIELILRKWTADDLARKGRWAHGR